MNNPDCIKFKKSNCKNCYKCIRNCPVKSIRFSNNQAYISEDECILCGHCFLVCPQNAKEIRNDVDFVKSLINSGQSVYASVAPSFVANYPKSNIESMEKALKKLGFKGAAETAIGAALVKKRYEELVRERKQTVIISSCCPSVNLLIQKHYPEAIKYLAAVVTPMEAHCLSIKAQNPAARTVFIGPCISKKQEAGQYPDAVDCALTFEELSEWLHSENITIEAMPDTSQTGRSRLFPVAGGIIRSMEQDSSYTYAIVDGIENCIQAIHDIIQGGISRCFIEMSACKGSCIGGPAMDKNCRTPVQNFVAVNAYAKEKEFGMPELPKEKMKKEINYIGFHRQLPGKAAIAEILMKMGKTKPEDELNCGSCGYDTCRDKAVAVLMGKADLSMCLPFLKEKAESFSDNIINNTPNGILVLNEALEIQQINLAARQIMNITNKADILGEQAIRILDPTIFMDVLHSGSNIYDRRQYLAEYGKHIAQTVLYDKSYHILICIMRDITEEENVRAQKDEISRKTIEIADKVAQKQMRVVQEIALLLGETTAETKIALTKLKESLRNE